MVEYNNVADGTAGSMSQGQTSGEIVLNPDGASSIKQIWMQATSAGTIVLKEAYFTDETTEVTPSTVLDFESDAVGKTYPMMHAWGWPDNNDDGVLSAATVATDPLDSNGKSLKVLAGNYDGVVYFDVTLPEGSTVADLSAIQFDSYFAADAHAAIELFMAPSNATLGNGTGFSTYPVYLKTIDTDAALQVGAGGEWFPITITKENILDPAYNKNGNAANFSTLDGLNQFKFGLGISGPAGTGYYLDNITFVLKGSGLIPVKLDVSNVCNTDGGIIVNGNNENVNIYAIDGRLVKQAVANKGNTIPLQRGLYIVKAGANNAVKVLVK